MSKVARGLGLSRSAISLWDKVPAEVVVEVERITGIPRERLRPDLYRRAVQETA
jgi:DNA-binding transcriptional regulator YdaS (Cro superfamily)